MGKTKIKEYATAIYQNAMVGKQSCSDIMEKCEDDELKVELQHEYDLFDTVCDDIEKFAKVNKFKLEDNNFFEKARLWTSINMSTLFNKSARHIAQLMLLGTTMGLTTIYKDKFDHKNVSAELDKYIDNLECIMEKNYENLKQYLKVCKEA